MLDINLIREKPDDVRKGMEKVGADPELINRILALDEQWRDLVSESEDLKAKRNRDSDKVRTAKDDD
ncbi:MAG: serine--tRNA ligase, partial [Planctomycetes bacterium]|nr:serine--tRNA ligase [Planctomycetota bacterium]